MTDVSRPINPTSVSAPAANYAHAVLTENAATWLHTSGVVPIAPDGTVPAALLEQAEVIWSNIMAMLGEANMVATNVVSVTTYVTPGHDLGPIMEARDRSLGGHHAASTLVVVPELARPEWRMEIAIIAAK